jgi:hypothetical protein
MLPRHPHGGGRTAYTRVTPEVVVELSVDLAVDGHARGIECDSCGCAGS